VDDFPAALVLVAVIALVGFLCWTFQSMWPLLILLVVSLS